MAFKVGDLVESEYFPDIQVVDEIKGNALRVNRQWLLEKQVELVERPEYVDEAEVLSRKASLPKIGIKHDQDKPDLSLLPKEALDATAAAFMYGANKYGRYNYLAGMDWHRPLSAALRHITAFNAGEDNDPESGLSHLAHAAAAINMAIVYQVRAIGKDTRYKS